MLIWPAFDKTSEAIYPSYEEKIFLHFLYYNVDITELKMLTTQNKPAVLKHVVLTTATQKEGYFQLQQ